MTNLTKGLASSLISAWLVVGCSTPHVSQISSATPNTFTTDITQTDFTNSANNLTAKLIQAGALSQCKTFTVTKVINKTDQYIDTKQLSDILSDNLANTNQSKYVGSSDEMPNAVDELDRQNQSGLYDHGTTAKLGKMTGAQCQFQGTIYSNQAISVADGKSRRVDYTFQVQLMDVQKNMAVWRNREVISKTLTY